MEQFTRQETRSVALAEMSKWGLLDRGWKFGIDRATTRNGQCSYSELKLTLTAQRVDHDSKEDVVSTIRHEIAHALHWIEYVDSGREADFFTKRWTGRCWKRIVPPHGAEWKRIAAKVGVENPKYASKSNAPRKTKNYKWSVVLVNGGIVKDLEIGLCRFPKRGMSGKSVRGHRGSRGKLFLVKATDWSAHLAGRKLISDLAFYQDYNYAPVSNGIAGLLV
jgi:hypothetical protein